MIKNICEKINATVIAGADEMEKEISGVYICDLLSWVMSHANKGDAWITVMSHANVVAVASLLDLGCVIVPEDIKMDEDAIKKANEEGIPLLSTSMNSYEIAIALNNMGLGL
ncbi:MAG: AraC family transcriptional regulator [Clostridia bacterium]|jgi:predicted transcriptional regulator|nr:AraC family transcriptional regulator [Clostridia bacterium]